MLHWPLLNDLNCKHLHKNVNDNLCSFVIFSQVFIKNLTKKYFMQLINFKSYYNKTKIGKICLFFNWEGADVHPHIKPIFYWFKNGPNKMMIHCIFPNFS